MSLNIIFFYVYQYETVNPGLVPSKNKPYIYTYIAFIFQFSIVITCCFCCCIFFLNNCVLIIVATSLEYRFYYRSRFISRHFVVGATFLYVLQLRSFDLFSCKILNFCHVFLNDTHCSISLRNTRNIVYLKLFYIKLKSKHFVSI